MAEEIQKLHWLWISSHDLKTELRQLQEEGRDVSGISGRFKRLIALGDSRLVQDSHQEHARGLLGQAQQLTMRKGYPYVEPSDLARIRKLRPSGPCRYAKLLPDKSMQDRIHGAWLGRCAGCLLGKPIEGIKSGELWPFLKDTKQFPLSDYIKFKSRKSIADKHRRFSKKAWFDTIADMPVDDDMNYTVTGMLLLEKYGTAITPGDVATFWMGNIPILATCTAERVAYRNFSRRIAPPQSALIANPYREWIGAQIRADAFGYAACGNPSLASELAWRDASISHVKNGIYGEMFVAAMIAAAPYCKDMKELIDVGLSEIPSKCRLAAAVKDAVEWHGSGLHYDQCVSKIHELWDEHSGHDWTHTISNAVICTVALLYSDDDFGVGICRAVEPCFDTDCNGATVGSILGMRLGAKKLPQSWVARLNDTLHTSLAGNNVVRISDMAQRTFKIYKETKGKRSA